eukprot:CAMPEP_0172564918 /NCGR_PEP_ID=MMETSP1067-20121228/106190_1 /TAXON_ID=265564 ORGANISM="Thalassiosira punctigera, Strain Tpunct2005C2" /NCGR_SAMPLE_ID=MMETSP1067 /ASSEMBLY_ACC=CAM_ASM_000444 /LENGTH=111 /DNA_ID=CAMNT_0013355709 /DNA_START=107 /DNA_END=440 /DNA_ORIENTATION=-
MRSFSDEGVRQRAPCAGGGRSQNCTGKSDLADIGRRGHVEEDAARHVVAAAVPAPPAQIDAPDEKDAPLPRVRGGASKGVLMLAPPAHPAMLPADETMPPTRDNAPPLAAP